jgi:hypothetical protein
MPVLQEQKLVIILTGLGILATQKSTAYTAGSTMVVRCGFDRNLSFPGFRHNAPLAF